MGDTNDTWWTYVVQTNDIGRHFRRSIAFEQQNHLINGCQLKQKSENEDEKTRQMDKRRRSFGTDVDVDASDAFKQTNFVQKLSKWKRQQEK